MLETAEPGITTTLRALVRRVGEPVIRNAVGAAIRQMGRQFVLGETIQGAMKRARDLEAKGYAYSYDMLGEAAMTAADAARYRAVYSDAISAIARACTRRLISAPIPEFRSNYPPFTLATKSPRPIGSCVNWSRYSPIWPVRRPKPAWA